MNQAYYMDYVLHMGCCQQRDYDLVGADLAPSRHFQMRVRYLLSPYNLYIIHSPLVQLMRLERAQTVESLVVDTGQVEENIVTKVVVHAKKWMKLGCDAGLRRMAGTC